MSVNDKQMIFMSGNGRYICACKIVFPCLSVPESIEDHSTSTNAEPGVNKSSKGSESDTELIVNQSWLNITQGVAKEDSEYATHAAETVRQWKRRHELIINQSWPNSRRSN